MTENSLHHQDLATLWATEYGRFQRSRDKIDTCGQWRRREVKPHIPKGWENPEAFEVMLPQATTLGQDVINFLGRKRPAAHRKPLGAGPTAQRLSSKVEEHVQEAMQELRANGEDLWDALLAFSCNDGEFAVIVSPRPAFWANLLAFTTDELDASGNPVIAPGFRRDSKGRAADDPWFVDKPGRTFKLDKSTSATTFEEYLREAKARKLPVVVRIIPGPMCLPIGMDPGTGKIGGLLIKSQRTALSLERDGFAFTMLGPEVAQPQYSGSSRALAGAGTTLTLFELHLAGKIIYQIVGPNNEPYRATLGDSSEAIVDMAADYGIDEIPGGYFFGGRHANETDPGKKGIPFLDAFISLIRGANQTQTAIVAHAFRYAFGGKGLRLDKELVGAWKEMGHPAKFAIEPMMIQVLPGELQELTTTGVGEDAHKIVDLALGELAALSPSSSMKGDASAGGFGQGVSMASAEHMLRQILEGALQAWECIAHWELAIVASISRKTGEPVPVYVTVKQARGSENPQVTALLELSHDDLQGDFSITASISQPKFQNLALMQAASGWVDAGRISETTWLEDIAGFEQPEEEQDRMWVEGQLKSLAGQMYTLELAAKKKGNQELLKLSALQQAGQATPGGSPSALLPPRPGGTGQDGASGPNTGDPAQAAVAGVMSGASQTGPQSNVIQATGQPAEVTT